MSIVHIKREEVLRLFDTKQNSGEGLATAFSLLAGEEMGLALLEHYLIRQGKKVTRLAGYPKTGQQSGPRLDGWLDIDGELAQIEVKNWGANAIGGLVRSTNSVQGWERFAKWFKDIKLQKSVYLMKTPEPYEKVDLAIACMWPDVRPQGVKDCFFSVDLETLPALVFPNAVLPKPTPFDKLHIFSMSLYLHTLTEEFVELSMPNTHKRLKRLENLLGICGEAGFPV